MSKDKRLNIKLDEGTILKLERIKKIHGDNSYTQSIKRAVAFLEFIDEKKEEGLELYMGKEAGGQLLQLVVAP